MKISEIKLSYHDNIPFEERTKLKGIDQTAKIIYELWNKDTIEMVEEFKVLYLGRANTIKGFLNVSKGGVSGTVVDVKIVLSTALKSLSSGIILAHNHPSGFLKPSLSDKDLTKKIKNAAKLLDIVVLDHIIISPIGDYYSFAQEGEI